MEQSAPLVFVHIPKCGGVSMRRVLEAIYWDEFGRNDQESFLTQDVTPYLAFATHHHYPEVRKVFGPKAELISITRDPVDNFVSLFNHLSTTKSHRLYEQTKDLSIEQFLPLIRAERGLYGNHQCRHICGEPDFDTARTTIERDYLMVAPLERFDELVMRLAKRYGWELPTEHFLRYNVSKKRATRADLSGDMIRTIYADNAEDAALHRYVTERFDQ